ncbi:MAG: orotidine-5'-phosphate decarboxylase [Acetobacteraceae bacterium]|nr:orotidine-5'-phosphate decarboxylase [Acetobacteraceae bacterium]
MPAGLIAALDTADPVQARRWAASLLPPCGMVKLGLEFYLANGPAGVRGLGDVPVFLDLKLHDIPNTVAGGVRAVLPLAPRMLTLHAAGGAAMIAAAREAADAAGAGRPKLLAVTVLTSLDSEALAATGVAGGPRQQALRLARLALDSGADGLVCSAQEAPMLRDAFGRSALLVVPGIRPTGSGAGDQRRTTTPREAAATGADWLVVGRPITQATDPACAAAAIVAELNAA